MSGFLLLRTRNSYAIKYGDPKRYFCTFGEKAHTSKRVSIIACNNVISKAQCATRTRLRRRTPCHGADASLLRVNSLAPLLNESSSSANKTDKPFACPFCLMHYVRGIRTRALRKRHSASFLAADRKRREKQALAFAKIERSGHSQQPDTKCQMQGISAKARLLSVDRRLLRVITLSHH